ncbi:hypothetical protein Q8F55_007656 [Vanrija albida]|uniref:DUF1772 domain-containing protein n=1 Tax=Vanrija albida TaxID=181172 RepID=A0ABR3PU55_9TREE
MPDLRATTFALVGASQLHSLVLYTNVGATAFGVLPLLRGRLADVTISPRDKVKAWASYYHSAKLWAVVPTALAAIADIYIARNHPVQAVRQLATGAAAVGLTIFPITFGYILPINKQLLAIEADDTLKPPANADELVHEWERRHLVRYVAYLGGWGLSLAALVLGALVLEVNEVVVI